MHLAHIETQTQLGHSCLHPIVLTSRPGYFGVIWTPKPSNITLQDTQNILQGIFLNVNFKHIFPSINLRAFYMDIMLYFSD